MQSVVVFGTYNEKNHPRIGVLIESLNLLNMNIITCNVPIDVDTAERIQLVRRPWRLTFFLIKLLRTWFHLVLRAREVGRQKPDVVVVGYMGVLDIHLAKLLFKAPIVLDHLAPLHGIAVDRGLRFQRLFRVLDQLAERRSNCVLVDTEINKVNVSDKSKVVVIPVGASSRWLRDDPLKRNSERPLRVCYFGAFTPLHGVDVIADAIIQLKGSDIQWTLIGRGQKYQNTFEKLAEQPNITWIDWLDEQQLIDIVANQDICLGVFGQSAKAMSVTPTKVFQGAAAGCAIVTSGTPTQRATLGAGAIFVPPNDSHALAAALSGLVDDRVQVQKLADEAARFARQNFMPDALTKRVELALELAMSPSGQPRRNR